MNGLEIAARRVLLTWNIFSDFVSCEWRRQPSPTNIKRCTDKSQVWLWREVWAEAVQGNNGQVELQKEMSEEENQEAFVNEDDAAT